MLAPTSHPPPSRVPPSDTEVPMATARRLAREEALPVGVSGGAAVAAALRLAAGLDEGHVAVVLPDNVMKALGEPGWDEESP